MVHTQQCDLQHLERMEHLQHTCNHAEPLQTLQRLQAAQQTHAPQRLHCGVLLLCLYLQYQCEDVLGDGQLLDALGVGLGRTDMVNVALAVKKLGEDPKKNVDTVGTAGSAAINTVGILCIYIKKRL